MDADDGGRRGKEHFDEIYVHIENELIITAAA